MSFQANIDTYKLTQLPRLCTLNMDNYVHNFQSLLFKRKTKNKDTKHLYSFNLSSNVFLNKKNTQKIKIILLPFISFSLFKNFFVFIIFVFYFVFLNWYHIFFFSLYYYMYNCNTGAWWYMAHTLLQTATFCTKEAT